MRWFASSSTGPSSDAGGVAARVAEPLLPPALLAALSGLELVSRTRRRRPSEGAHPALRHGREDEFFQHRPYVRGDDLRAVDWRASARTGHPLVKERHQPARRPLTLLLDTSESMLFPASDPLGMDTKLAQARVLAAALAFLALRRGDSVQLARLSGPAFEKIARLRPVPRALHAISGTLSALGPTGRGDVAAGLSRVGASVARNGLVVLLSDLYGDETLLLSSIASLRRVAEVAVLHVLSAAELEIPAGLTDLEELEGGSVVSLDRESVKPYAARVAGWRDRLRGGALAAGADFVDVDAAEPAAHVLDRWLRRAS